MRVQVRVQLRLRLRLVAAVLVVVFSVVAERFIRKLDLDREKVNINGGAMALGHPIGATGSILVGTALDELERQNGRYALITMCAAGGMAPAIIIGRV